MADINVAYFTRFAEDLAGEMFLSQSCKNWTMGKKVPADNYIKNTQIILLGF